MTKDRKIPAVYVSSTGYTTTSCKDVDAVTFRRNAKKAILLAVSVRANNLNSRRGKPVIGAKSIKQRGKIKHGLTLSEDSAHAAFLALGGELGIATDFLEKILYDENTDEALFLALGEQLGYDMSDFVPNEVESTTF